MVPPYAAVILCGLPATVSAEVAYVAMPEAFVVPVPRVVVPSRNVTVPPAGAVPLPGEFTVTVAVKVTDWPNTEALNGLKVVVVLAMPTWCAWVPALLPKLVSPA